MWFEPVECAQARAAVAGCRFREAAELLLRAKRRDHRACRQLLGELLEPLLSEARLALEQSQFDLARQMIELAQQCGAEGVTFEELRDRIVSAHQIADVQQQVAKRRTQQARMLARDGRLQSALDWAAEIDGRSLVADRDDWKHQAERLDRYIAAARNHLDRHQWAAAAERLAHAAAIERLDPRVVAMQLELAENQPPLKEKQPSGPGGKNHRVESCDAGSARQRSRAWHNHDESSMNCRFPISDQASLFALSDGESRVLVCRRSSVVIGGADAADADIALRGRLRGLQVLLIRDGTTFRASSAWAGSRLCINGKRLGVGNSVVLCDGDLFDFGDGQIRFRFFQPESAEPVAVLIADPATAPRDVSHSRLDRIILTASGIRVGTSSLAHWTLPDLPCEELRLTFGQECGTAAVSDGIAWWESPHNSEAGQLHVEPDFSEAERLSRGLLGGAVSGIVIRLQSGPLS